MVNTFVIGSLEYTCENLDGRRLNKQKVEAMQIIDALNGESNGWVNHPAVKMWKGYTNGLKYYFNKIVEECLKRGFKNTLDLYELNDSDVIYETIERKRKSDNKIIFPWWFTWKPLIQTHRCSLLRKMPEFYQNIFKGKIDKKYIDKGYIWPTKLSEEQIINFDVSYCEEIGSGAPANYRWTREEVEQWLENKYINPKTGRKIKETKTGVYADISKACKIYGL